MSLLWTAVVLFIGMMFGMWLTRLTLPTGELLIDCSDEEKETFKFVLGNLEPHELLKHRVMLLRIKDITQK